jgi:hypothetical protein
MRRSLGTAVFSGMLGVTLFGIFLTPVFYYILQWFGVQAVPRPVPLAEVAAPPGAFTAGHGVVLVKEVEAALEALRVAPEDGAARRRAEDVLRTALTRLREQSEGGGPAPPQ